MIDNWQRFEVATEYIAAFLFGVSIGYEWHSVAVAVGSFMVGRVTGRITAERIKRWRQRSRNTQTPTRS